MENQDKQERKDDQAVRDFQEKKPDLTLIPGQDRIFRYENYVGLKEVQKHWGWFLGVGILLIFLGTLAIGGAGFVTMVSMVFFGTLMLIGGVVQGINAIKTRNGDGFLVNLLTALLYIVVGLMLLLNPAIGAITLTLLLAVFYTVSGLFKIVAAVFNRYAQWGWMLFSGIVSLVLGLMIWAEWPISGLWVIGLFIGIDMIIVGWIWVTLALTAKSLNKRIL
ncbi:MAG: HdeD family acid-resistance protein [Parachlamydiaceae bacterium]|nr:HdeD family acid-resistance protein [Parachlamydiaceae bacterium]